MSDDTKLKMPPPGERRIIPASTMPQGMNHPAFGPSTPRVSLPPGAIQPAPDAEPLTAAVTYIPAPGLEDTAPNGIYWATDRGVVLSPAIQEPIQLTAMPEGEEKGEAGAPEDARPEDQTASSETGE